MSIEKKYRQVMDQMAAMLNYPWEKPEFYAAWLSQTYYYTSRSSRLLLMASARCDMNQSILHRRFSTHATEEKGHEILAQRDLADMGYDAKTLPEFSVTTSFYATQFYKIQNECSENFMGWIFPLEGIAVEHCGQIRDRLRAAGLPTRFLDVHVDEDVDHVESAFKAVKNLTPEQEKGLLTNMDLTKDMYLMMLDECQKRGGQLSKSLKAG